MTATPAATLAVAVRLPADTGSHDAALDSFDALLPGQSVVVVAEREPRELLQRLQADRKGTFEWSLLEAGPSTFRVELTRRSAEPGASREVGEALAWDHDRLDAIEKRAFDHLEAGDVDGARAAWNEFAVGLRRHIRFEEEILFPTFEARVGVSPEAGPTAVMRGEHRDIEALIEAVGRALGGDDAPLPLRAELHHVLGQHNLKEERVLYPVTDQVLAPAERDALVGRIQAS
jgi:regulator of cell morphogenesis and NO signaling